MSTGEIGVSAMSGVKASPEPAPPAPVLEARDANVEPDVTTLFEHGHLEPLRTKAEVDTRRDIINVYICKAPAKATGEIVQAMRNVPKQETIPLLHLRRVAKNDFVPPSLQKYAAANSSAASRTSSRPDSRPGSRPSSSGSGTRPRGPPTQLILLCPTSLITVRELKKTLSWTSPFLDIYPPRLEVVPVPRYPPTSADHAALMSARYWPTVYNNTNPFGPHPSIVARATRQTSTNAAKWMRLARQVGSEASANGCGVGVGAVIVERLADDSERVVAVAGDARWSSSRFRGTTGDPARHAIMRAVALVAEKRLRIDFEVHKDSKRKAVDAPTAKFPSTATSQDPLTAQEAKYFGATDTLSPKGYLCLNLNVYVTHEPCLCCCMAILHSRIGGAVFGREMSMTGGLRADRDGAGESIEPARFLEKLSLKDEGTLLKYGLFWRDDLNWKFHAWKWTFGQPEEETDIESLPTRLHV